jgi:predicted secreted protein
MKLLIVMLFMAGCNSPQKADTALSTDTIRATVNKPSSIELSTSMGTGYSWQPIDSLYTGTIRIDSVTVVNNKTKEDGADTQIFHFTPLKKGNITILFIRKRPWESADKRDKEKSITINID